MIRAATPADIPRIIELGITLHATTSYASQPYVHEKAAAFLLQLIEGEGVVFVAVVGGETVGAMAGGIVDQWFSHDLIAYDYSIFVEPSRRNGIIALRLIKAFIEWARIKGAAQVQMGICTAVNVEAVSRLYESAGFRLAGPLYVQELSPCT